MSRKLTGLTVFGTIATAGSAIIFVSGASGSLPPRSGDPWWWWVVVLITGGSAVGAIFAITLWPADAVRHRLAGWRERPRLEVTPLLGQGLLVFPERALLAAVKSTGTTALKELLADDGFQPDINRQRAIPADFVWLNVRNAAMKSMGDAQNVWAEIKFERFRMSPARWRDSPPPQEVSNIADITDRVTLRSGTTRQFDVVFRMAGETEAHGLNTDAMSYPLWMRPGWELPVGTHHAEVTLSADNVRQPARLKLLITVPDSGGLTVAVTRE